MCRCDNCCCFLVSAAATSFYWMKGYLNEDEDQGVGDSEGR